MDELIERGREVLESPAALTAVVLAIAAVVGVIATRILRRVIARIARGTDTKLDDLLAARLSGPMSTLLTLQLFRVGLRWVPLPVETQSLVVGTITVLTIVNVLWAAFRGIDLTRSIIEQRPWAVERPASRSLISLASRFAKVAVLILGTLVALSQFGVSIASLIAGLGIGGLVIALAAQKTVENVFGAVSIGVDQPMREGDFVKIYDFVGTVEQIGLRSTRIRTLDRTVITIPNGELANQRIESFAARDRLRLACTIGVTYGTTAAQLRDVRDRLERTLRAHPKIWPDAVVVRFKELASSSLDFEVMAWFLTTDWGEFQQIREQILIEFIEQIEQAGTSVAFPTRTVHVVAETA